MQYNWPAINEEIRNIFEPTVKFLDEKGNEDKSWVAGFHDTLHQTDQFFAYGSDSYLQRTLGRMQERCDYRSCRSLKVWREDRYKLFDDVSEMIGEMEEHVRDYYGDKYNFAPGVKLPFKVDISENIGSEASVIRRIIRAARTKKA